MIQSSVTTDLAASPTRQRRMDRIRRLSRLLAVVCVATSGLLVAAIFFYWALTPAQVLFSKAGIADVRVNEIDFSARALAFAISMVPVGALVYGLLSARRCFEAFAGGQIFSSEPIGRLKAFSIAVAASALLKPFAGAALSVLLSFNNGEGTKSLSVGIDSDMFIALIFSGTVAVIAWVMTEALDIADENNQFV